MIKNKLVLVLSCMFGLLNAQNDYFFSILNNSYQNIQNSTSITNGLIWYDFSAQIPIGFDFDFFGENINELFIHSDVAAPNILTPAENYVGVHPYIIPFGASIVDRAMDASFSNENEPGGVSNISYVTEGEEGNRIFKLEYNNIGFEEDIWENENSIDYVNFQLWFYESSNIIEIHFGESNITDPEIDFQGATGPFVWLIPQLSLNEDGEGGPVSELYSLTGNASNPQLAYDIELNSITGMPQDGIVYRFNPQNMNLLDVDNYKEIQIYPNPTSNYLNIKSENNIESLKIININNQLIKEIINPMNTINIGFLRSGLYFLIIESNGKNQTFKIQKK